jgi:L-threonylcarbamoyladenylate synthase
MRHTPTDSGLPDEEIQLCIEVLRSGGILLYPTDTVWGLGCDARNAEAVQKIYDIKKRDDSKSLIVLLHSEGFLNKYVRHVPAVAWDLIELTDKPLTIIYDQVGGMAPNVIAPDGSCGIRICKDPFCNRLLHKFGRPLVSTSANISGEPTPRNFKEISPAIKSAVDHIANWRQDELKEAEPSTIMRLKNNSEIEVIRK